MDKFFSECPCRRWACIWDVDAQECSSSCVCRVVDEDLIEDAVDSWHASTHDQMGVELHEWLGWTWEEYKRWVEGYDPPGIDDHPSRA